MCGIVGLTAGVVDRERLARASDCQAHRGPDDAGVYFGDGVGLAARRLSIIDLAGGHQPLSNERGDIWITFNGEVMNAPELRATLQASGHYFRTLSDTEVIVHAYEEWGDDCVTRLRGMFAFGIGMNRVAGCYLPAIASASNRSITRPVGPPSRFRLKFARSLSCYRRSLRQQNRQRCTSYSAKDGFPHP